MRLYIVRKVPRGHGWIVWEGGVRGGDLVGDLPHPKYYGKTWFVVRATRDDADPVICVEHITMGSRPPYGGCEILGLSDALALWGVQVIPR